MERALASLLAATMDAIGGASASKLSLASAMLRAWPFQVLAALYGWVWGKAAPSLSTKVFRVPLVSSRGITWKI
eukprot:6774015-Prymnesium_polylepis.1